MGNGDQDHNPLRTGFQIAPRIRVKKLKPQDDPKSVNFITATQCDSVVCMGPTSLYALPAMSEHAPVDMAEGVLGDLLPDLDQDIRELLDSLWHYLAVSDAMMRNVPEVLSWIQVWGM